MGFRFSQFEFGVLDLVEKKKDIFGAVVPGFLTVFDFLEQRLILLVRLHVHQLAFIAGDALFVLFHLPLFAAALILEFLELRRALVHRGLRGTDARPRFVDERGDLLLLFDETIDRDIDLLKIAQPENLLLKRIHRNLPSKQNKRVFFDPQRPHGDADFFRGEHGG
ncbi:MAG: hypothetical protein M5R36_29370 [Deltaproteobacteria bacterium]|nr:hypothetical protein [Deltaproteobacteria bacterium]